MLRMTAFLSVEVFLHVLSYDWIVFGPQVVTHWNHIAMSRVMQKKNSKAKDGGLASAPIAQQLYWLLSGMVKVSIDMLSGRDLGPKAFKHWWSHSSPTSNQQPSPDTTVKKLWYSSPWEFQLYRLVCGISDLKTDKLSVQKI